MARTSLIAIVTLAVLVDGFVGSPLSHWLLPMLTTAVCQLQHLYVAATGMFVTNATNSVQLCLRLIAGDASVRPLSCSLHALGLTVYRGTDWGASTCP